MIIPSEEHLNQITNCKFVHRNQFKDTFFSKRRGKSYDEQFQQRRKKVKLSDCKRPRFDEIMCPICLDIFQRVTTTICGHAFCERCLFDSLIRKAECPVCRVKIRSHQFQYCQSFDNRVAALVNEFGDEQLKSEFMRRSNEKNQWDEKKQIVNLEINQKVDIMDAQFVWCVGIIQGISKQELFIHYDGWGKEYDEFIPINSHRIAPLGLYTTRTDIPQYQQQDTQELPRIYDFIALFLEYPILNGRT